ncbi:hypothetical protein ACFQZZ_08495 [Nocardia sp. GCM10030253]|uniref:hypothetical protein n=1 Tax=Nocardia sp. GCM10030253 TaxID=3273404 RepID=UPI0036422853
MPRWFRVHAPEEDAWYWFEVGDDGWVLRQAVFVAALPVPVPDAPVPIIDGVVGGASVAASADELVRVREMYGLPGVQFYEAVYGVLAEGPIGTAEGAVDAARAEFEQVWNMALRHRHFSRYDTGPLPVGTRVSGTVAALPWGPGITGLFVDIDSAAQGFRSPDDRPAGYFVDLLNLPRNPEDWPRVGAVLSLEVTTIRISLHSLNKRTDIQVRLRPVHDA